MKDTKEINKVVYLENNNILPNRFQPRKYFDEEEIMQLSESIKEHGVINPVIVRKLGDKYELVAGERRYKANILAGNEDIPAIIMDVNDKESSEIAVVENIQRKDLNAIEEAISYKRILDIGYMTQEQLAQKMGKSQASIANKIRLLKLSDKVQDALMKKAISERHARSLLKLESQKKQNELLDRIIKERLTVRKTDEEIEKMNNNMMNENLNMYNNTPDNSSNTITPVMPGTNVSDVNISGVPEKQVVNNTVENNALETVANPSVENSFTEPTITPSADPVSQLGQSPLEAVENNIQEQPEKTTVQTIPTVSIDDVLAKANQPSVVGNQAFAPVAPQTNNNVSFAQPEVGVPNLSPINEDPTPIGNSNNNMNFNMPEINPIVDNAGLNGMYNSETPNLGPTSAPILEPKPIDVSNNIQGVEQPAIDSANIKSTNENPQTVDSFINSFTNPIGAPTTDDINKDVSTAPAQNLNAFGTANINNEMSNSPINTSPIIDTTADANNEQQNNQTLNNSPVAPIMPEQPQMEPAPTPEPIIVNDYNDQYDPIMPKDQNNKPTIDFKTIINLIRKCSQAIENSGYKIETEEYNLDNLYQVVFKIDKQ